MPKCEFRPGRQNCPNKAVVCDTIEVFKGLLAELEGVLKIEELKKALCDYDDPKAREQCPAYDSLAKDGTQSPWVK